jgi:hypothetical protein
MCLNENQVVDATCEFLESNGVTVEQRCTTKQKGIDIIARRPGSVRKLLIEAKGGTSTDPSSKKYGEDYVSRKVYDVVAKAFYAGVCLRSDPEHEGNEVALAFPSTDLFLRYVKPLAAALIRMSIGLMLVSPDRTVTCHAMSPFRPGTRIQGATGSRPQDGGEACS